VGLISGPVVRPFSSVYTRPALRYGVTPKRACSTFPLAAAVRAARCVGIYHFVSRIKPQITAPERQRESRASVEAQLQIDSFQRDLLGTIVDHLDVLTGVRELNLRHKGCMLDI
jgi:hypothetical protein